MLAHRATKLVVLPKHNTPVVKKRGIAMSEPVVLYEEINHIGYITLNRPEAMNSLTYESYDLLEDSVRQSKARVIVITSSDERFVQEMM